MGTKIPKEYRVLSDPPVEIYTPGDNPGVDLTSTEVISVPDEYENISRQQGRITKASPLMRDYALEGVGGIIPSDTLLPTPDGMQRIGDLRPGDVVFGADGKPAPIGILDTIYPMDVVELTLKDGRKFCVGDRSLVMTRTMKSPSKTRRFIRAMDIVENGANSKRGYNWGVPLCYPVEYPSKDLSLHPYLMGVFLGDGCKNPNGKFTQSSGDIEIVDAVARGLGAERYKRRQGCFSWDFYTGELLGWNKDRYYYGDPIKIREIAPEYERLLSQHYASEKWIPEEYLLGSQSQRLALLCGLMDTEGNIYKRTAEGEAERYNVVYSTTSVDLLHGVQRLIWSLGGSANIVINKTPERNGVRTTQYELTLIVDPSVKRLFFKLPRKLEIADEAATYKTKKGYDKISIIAARRVEMPKEMCRIVVDASDHLFLTENYVVLHDGSEYNVEPVLS